MEAAMRDNHCDLFDAFDVKQESSSAHHPHAPASAADDYVGEWQVLIDRAENPPSLLQRWRDERDLRDELEVSVPEDLCQEPMK
jgi:hypothetical protein